MSFLFDLCCDSCKSNCEIRERVKREKGGEVSQARGEAGNCLTACIAQRLAAAGCPLGNCLSPGLSIMALRLFVLIYVCKNTLA